MRLISVGEPGQYDAIFACDPGLTTGVATWIDGATQFAQIEGQMQFLEYAWTVLHQYRPIVVVEAYIITGNTVKLSRQYEPLEIIGALRWMSHLLGLTFLMQTPSQAKNFSTDQKLKAIGWYEKGLGHGMDAARHLLLYMAATRKEDAIIQKLLTTL